MDPIMVFAYRDE